MADPRSTRTRRAVLSYDHLKQLRPDWQDLLIKDYQGILQDSTFIADELDKVEVIVIDNSGAIADLQDSHYPNIAAQVQFLQRRLDGLPEFTVDTTGFTADSTFITADKVIA